MTRRGGAEITDYTNTTPSVSVADYYLSIHWFSTKVYIVYNIPSEVPKRITKCIIVVSKKTDAIITRLQ